MMTAVRNNELSAIYVYSFSRFARSTTHLLNALEEMKKYGIYAEKLDMLKEEREAREKMDVKEPEPAPLSQAETPSPAFYTSEPTV